ncbi:MAG TPA: ABC transporter permease [Thermomicrobiales bacterium]|nr:ABC transporter permease [Thermomicrobiales bacterium]
MMAEERVAPLVISRRQGFLITFVQRNHIASVAASILVLIVVSAIIAPVLAPGDPVDMSPIDRLKSPADAGYLGTDAFGRDILSRILYGARISLGVGVVSVLAAAAVGTLIGLVSGYLGGWQEYLTMRLMDVLFSFPSILLAILIVSIWGAGFSSIVLAIALVQTPIFARIVRASTLSLKEMEYVHAAKTAGASTWRILSRHVLPNVAAPILVQLALSMSGAVVLEAALSYLGLGAVPPTPSLGSMLSENRSAMEIAPWTVLYPGIALAILVLCINMLGDALRDFLDPRLRTAMSP